MKGATFFSGGGAADIGMKLAGITPIIGIEYDDKIATVARNNGLNVKTANMLEIDANLLPDFDIAHFSPPCPRYSIANKNAKETQEDINLAKSIANIILIKQPKYITLENVYKYRLSKSWQIINDVLKNLNYVVSIFHVDFSKLNVPQTRKRMIVMAVRSGLFYPQLQHFQKTKGWYEVLKDLIQGFETVEFPPYQLKRLPIVSNDYFIEGRAGGKRNLIYRLRHQPVMTITTSSGGNIYKVMVNNKIRRVSKRGLARLQTFPNTYKLPNGETLSRLIIGNACPPVGMKHIFESIINY